MTNYEYIKPQTNDYKIYYYLSNLWLSKDKLGILIEDNINIDQIKLEHNNLLNDYIKLLPLLEQNIELTQFIKIIKENIKLFRLFGYQKNYSLNLNEHSVNLKSEGCDNDNINIVINNITDKDIIDVYNYIKLTNIQKKSNIKNFSNCKVIPQYKYGNITEANNFRYVINHHNVIKIIDRLWSINVLYKCGNNLLDDKIFKSGLINPDFKDIEKIANLKTNNLNNKVIIDIKKAYDSLEWNVIYKLLLSNLTRKINKKDAIIFIEEYFIILKNRNLFYKDKLIKFSKGIPIGLPSSSIVFNFVFEEIVLRWLYNNKEFKQHFLLTIYVDDILFDFLINNKINYIIINFINYIKLYGFNVNIDKLKVSPNIYDKTIGSVLLYNDFYLGIPFTRDIKLYGILILQTFQKKYNHQLSWNDLYNIIINNKINKNCILGFLNYKLKPLLNNNIKINEEIIINFIKKYYI